MSLAQWVIDCIHEMMARLNALMLCLLLYLGVLYWMKWQWLLNSLGLTNWMEDLGLNYWLEVLIWLSD